MRCTRPTTSRFAPAGTSWPTPWTTALAAAPTARSTAKCGPASRWPIAIIIRPGWRRYGNDGYGESESSVINFPATEQPVPNSGLRGRVWPIFTGERGHYELARLVLQGKPDAAALGKLRDTYVRGL